LGFALGLEPAVSVWLTEHEWMWTVAGKARRDLDSLEYGETTTFHRFWKQNEAVVAYTEMPFNVGIDIWSDDGPAVAVLEAASHRSAECKRA
jgi:hypothetical protein